MTDLFTTLGQRRKAIDALLLERKRGKQRSHAVVVAALCYLKHSRNWVKRSTFVAHSEPKD